MYVCVWDGDTSRHTVTDSAARRQTPINETGGVIETAAAVALENHVGRYTQKTHVPAYPYINMHLMHLHIYTHTAELQF